MLGGVGGELERRQRGVDPPRDLRRREPQRARPERDVVPQRPREQLLVGVLEHRADAPGEGLGRPAASVPVAHRDGALRGMDQARHQTQQRGFPRPVATEQRRALARCEGERDVPQRGHRSIGEGDMLEAELGVHCRHRRSACATVNG